MFDSIFTTYSVGLVFLMIGVGIVDGIVLSFLLSLKVRSSKGFYVTLALMPTVVSFIFVILNVLINKDSTTAIVTVASVMVGLGLIRFRSAPGKAEEMFSLFLAVGIGAVLGLGYLTYASIASIIIPLLFVGLMSTNLLKNRRLSGEKLLKVTIPESLEYKDVFDETFKHYLKEFEMVGVKTTGLGSMFRLSYRIVMKNPEEEKEMIDELRVKNGNLEISVLPYVDDYKTL